MRRAPVLLAVLAAAALSTSRAGARTDDKQQCLAASDQGQQLRDDGKYRQAREAFAACARDACPALVRRDCMKWLADLEQASPSIVVGAKDDKGADLVDVTVLVDGVPLVTKLDGKPTQIDPGAHVLRFQTRGYPSVEQHVMVRAGEKSRLVAVQFGTPAPAIPAGPVAPASTSAPPADSGLTPQGTRTSAWVFGGISVAAFATEAYFGFSGLSDRSNLKNQPCAKSASCPESSVDSIRTKFTVADIGLGVGLASAAISAYLFLAPPSETAPSHPTAAVDVVPVPGGAAMSVAGRF
ncbi:MAG TPA: hypothetical protein VGL81_18575 [Polyangiaceae bacterium]